MEHLSPSSEEIRLRDEDSENDEGHPRNDQIKRIKLHSVNQYYMHFIDSFKVLSRTGLLQFYLLQS